MNILPYDPASIRVLLVATDPETVRTAGSLLKNDGFDIFLAHGLGQAAGRCMEESIDLVVCASELDDGDPYAFCDRMSGVCSDASRRSPPFIFLVDRDAPQAMARAFRAGAADCVSMPCQAEEFLARVRRELELLHTRRNLASQSRELDDAWRTIDAFARLDPATGLPDSLYAGRRLEEELSRSARSAVPSCLILARLPGSTAAGSDSPNLIKPVASLLRAMLRDHDILCRWSDDELFLLLPDCGKEGGSALLRRCGRLLRELEPGLVPSWPGPEDLRILLLDPEDRGKDSQTEEARTLLKLRAQQASCVQETPRAQGTEPGPKA